MDKYATQFIGKDVTITVDRPLGTPHPLYPTITYGVNYGFVPGTKAPDGKEVDAYILGVDEPLQTFTGYCIAVLHRTNDDDDKLIVVKPGVQISDEEIRKQTYFQEQYYSSVIIRLSD